MHALVQFIQGFVHANARSSKHFTVKVSGGAEDNMISDPQFFFP